MICTDCSPGLLRLADTSSVAARAGAWRSISARTIRTRSAAIRLSMASVDSLRSASTWRIASRFSSSLELRNERCGSPHFAFGWFIAAWNSSALVTSLAILRWL